MIECTRRVRRALAAIAVGSLAAAAPAAPASTSDGLGRSERARGGVNGPILSTYVGQRKPLFELGLRGATRTILSEADVATASRNGSRIAFTRQVGASEDAIFLADRDGHVLRRIPTPQIEVTAGMTLSPDRRTVVFTGTVYGPSDPPYGRFGIFSVNVDGSDFKVLQEDDFATGTGSSSPRFSPDGSLIAYTRPGPLNERRDIVDNPDVWIMRADGSNQRPVLAHRADGESQPFFSPDGKRLAYVRSTAIFDQKSGKVEGHELSIVTSSLRGRHRRPVTERTFDALHSPVFAPNGRRIAYAREQAIHTIRLDGRRDRAVPGQRTGRQGHEYVPLLWLRR